MMTSVKISEMTRARAAVQGAIDDDDAAEGRLAVGLEGFLPCDAEVFIVLADAAGIGVFENGDGGADEFENEIRGCLDVEDVGVAEVLALEFGEAGGKISVESAFLVGVVAIAEFLFEG